jgi:hypothetical protein
VKVEEFLKFAFELDGARRLCGKRGEAGEKGGQMRQADRQIEQQQTKRHKQPTDRPSREEVEVSCTTTTSRSILVEAMVMSFSWTVPIS